MQVCVRPMEANLTHDTETFGRMVKLSLFSPLTARSIWEVSIKGLNLVRWEVRIPTGTIDSFSRFLLEQIR